MQARTDLARIEEMIAQGRFAPALAMAERALARRPGDIDLVSVMSFILFKMRSYVRAEHYARELVRLWPESGHAQHNLGNALLRLGRAAEALPILRRALEMEPGEADIYVAVSDALSQLSRFVESGEVAGAGLRRFPGNLKLRSHAAHALHNRGRADEALPLRRALAAELPTDLETLDLLLCALNYAPGVSGEEMAATHRRYGALMDAANGGAVARPPGAGGARGAGRPLRVGLLSPDLRDHAVGHLIENFIEHADRRVLHVGCYTTTREDAVSARLKAKSDVWRLFHGVTFASVAEAIRRDGVDVVIDLAGHTAGQLLATMALRPAPVLMTYTGYPNTTGLACVDFRIVDSLTDPPGYERFATERLLRLDPCYMSYRPPEVMPDVTPLPAGRDGAVTFGSFSSLLKYNGAMLGLWARVLRAVPRSRLVLMHTGLKDEGVCADLKARFAALGVEAPRVETRKPQASRDGVFREYQDIDIGLDTFPYNGGVTLVESLLMGVPFVSMAGGVSAARTGLSVLSAVGLADLCAADEDGFVSVAVGLAADRGRLADLRVGLRGTLLRSCICDGPGFARRMEKLLMDAWNQVGSGV